VRGRLPFSVRGFCEGFLRFLQFSTLDDADPPSMLPFQGFSLVVSLNIDSFPPGLPGNFRNIPFFESLCSSPGGLLPLQTFPCC